MKKNYFLTLLLTILTTVAFGQELVVNGGLENWDTDTKPTGWTKAESITKSTEKHSGTYSAFRNAGSGTKDLSQTITGITPGASYTVSLWYKVAAGDGTDARIWSFWKNGSTNLSDHATELRGGSSTGYLDNNGGVWTQYTVTLTAPANADSFYFEVRSYSGAQVYWDDLSLVKNTQAVPSLAINSPANNATIPSSDITVSLSVQNFNVAQTNGGGDGHIHYSLDNGATVMKYDTNDFTLTGLTAGEHILKVWLVDNAHQPLNPVVEQTATFTVTSYTQVANIAALRAGTNGTFYELTGEAVMTYNAGGSRNQKYIQDATGAILIDDLAGKITTTYNQFDGITGIKGKLTSYRGIKQFIPEEDPGTATSTGNTITVQDVTLADLKANINDYESEWVNITAAQFDTADGTAVFEARKSYDISNGANKMVFRTNFSNADFIGTVIPQGVHSIKGIAGRYNSTVQIYSTELANIVLGTTKNQIKGFGVYPNPVNGNSFVITTASVSLKNVSIYNVLGKQVVTTKFEGTSKNIDIANLNSGIYIVKIEENGNTATKKLVIK